MMSFLRKHSSILLVLVLAFIVRGAFFFIKDHFFAYGYTLDSQFYIDHARHLLENHAFLTHGEGPLYTLFIAGAFSLFGKSVPVFIFLQILLGALTAAAVFLLTKTYFKNERYALASGILYAVDPFFVYFSSFVMTENLAIPLIVLFFLLLFNAWEKGGVLRFAATGLVLGASLLCRGVLAAFIPILLVCAWLFDRYAGLKKAFLILAIAGLTILPWEIYLYQTFGRPVFIQVKKGSQLYQSLLPYGTDYASIVRWHSECGKSADELKVLATNDEIFIDQFYTHRARRWMHEHPRLVLRRAVEKMTDFWRPFPNPPYPQPVRAAAGIYMLAIYALVIISLTVIRNRYHIFTLGFIISAALPFLVFFPQVRYRMPVHVFLLVLAGAGLVKVLYGLKSKTAS